MGHATIVESEHWGADEAEPQRDDECLSHLACTSKISCKVEVQKFLLPPLKNIEDVSL
jgi:hypothetical protein